MALLHVVAKREQGLELWCRYNERLLELHRERSFPLIEFHDDPELFKRRLRQLCEALCLPGRFRSPRFFEDELRTRPQVEDHELGPALGIYEQLRVRELSVGPEKGGLA